MRRFVSILAAAALALSPSVALSQAVAAFRGPGVPGAVVQVKAADPLPVTCISGCSGGGTTTITGVVPVSDNGGSLTVDGPLTDGQLRASALPVSIGGTVTVTGGLTDTQIRATALPVSVSGTATVSISGTPTVTLSGLPTVTVGNASLPVTGTFWQATQPVSLTSTAITGSVAVTGPLTDTQIRAAALPVSLTSTTITGSVSVTGPLTDAQLRAASVPVSLTSTTLTGTSAISAAALPLPTGAATSAKQAQLGTAGTASADVLTVQGIASMTALKVDGSAVTQPVSGVFYPATQPVSGTVAVTGALTDSQLRASSVPVSLTSTTLTGTSAVSVSALPLPTGAATSARQPSIGTAGTASADVISVQGVAGATALKVDGSAVTQPVSGTIGVSGTVAVSGPLTDAQIRASALPVSGTFYQATQPVSVASTLSVNQTQTNGVTTATGNGVAGTGTQRVSIASDNSAFSVNAAQSGTWNIGSIITLPSLPAGANSIGSVTVSGTTAVSGPLTDTQLRASAVPISGTVTTSPSGTQAVSGTVTANAGSGTFAVSGPLTDAQLRATPVPVSASVTPAVDVTASGSLAALNATLPLSVANGYSGTVVQITGTWAGTIQFEGTLDGTNWSPINGVFAGGTMPAPTVTANGVIRLTPGGLSQIRANMVSYTSGSATVTMRASTGVGGTFLNQSLTVGSNIIGKVGIDQTTPGTSNAVSITNATIAVTGPVTDAQLRASVVPVSLASTTVTGSVAVTGPITDTQLRASAVPVSLTSTTITGTTAISAAALPLPSGAATSVNQVTNAAQGSTTSGQTGSLVQGAVTTAAPTYVTAQTSPLSLTTGGALRIDGSGSTQPVSLATNTPTLAAGSAIVGKFGIDQTTPGTTNAVAVTNSSFAVTGPLTDAQLRATAVPISLTSTTITGTSAVSATSLPLPTGAATETTISALNAKVTAVNTGAVTISTALPTGANVIGSVTQSGTWNVGSVTTLPALPTGANVIGALTANQSVNTAQINGITPLMGNGATGTGSPRVTIASDNTAFSVIATQVVGSNATTGDTGAKTATGNGATLTNAGNKGVQVVVNLGTVSGTSPTGVFKAQGSVDGGTTWFDLPGATTATLTATGAYGIMIYPGVAVTAGTTTTGSTATASMVIPRTWRMVWTIGGTTPSFTITNIQYNYLPN